MNAQEIRNLAEQQIKSIEPNDYVFVSANGNTVTVGENEVGYWVTDNGEEAGNLTYAAALDAIVENLTALNTPSPVAS